MELHTIIQKLYKERTKLDDVISSLEQVLAAGAAKPERVKTRRGRTSMGAEERQIVSQRMREYWTRRRRERAGEVAQ
jgi:hypothetical protein